MVATRVKFAFPPPVSYRATMLASSVAPHCNSPSSHTTSHDAVVTRLIAVTFRRTQDNHHNLKMTERKKIV